MKTRLLFPIILLFFLCAQSESNQLFAQEKKGDLEDFADDFEDDDSDDSDDEGSEFFFWLFFEHIGDVAQLWGGAAGTEFGPYPSFPYAATDGFMTYTNDHRSYFFNTEIGYSQVNEDLRSYLLRWETQFVGRSKLSFDMTVYQEDVLNEFTHLAKQDYLALYGFRYGYAVYRSPQLLLNIEGGYRSLYHNRHHNGPEIALDMQLFPRNPLIFETRLAAAYLGNSPLYTVESSAGFMFGRLELLAGIRLLKNGDQDLLDGFRFGFRVWY